MLNQTERTVHIPELLLIGGNTRHIGKTTLACEIIRNFSGLYQITSFKITSIYADDEGRHGRHEPILSGDFSIIKENSFTKLKDTAKMLTAGASDSYFIQAVDSAVNKAWDVFYKGVPKHHLMVCESRSLRRFVAPGLFIYLKSSKIENEKPHHRWLENLADLVLVDPNPTEVSNLVRRIKVIKNCWEIF